MDGCARSSGGSTAARVVVMDCRQLADQTCRPAWLHLFICYPADEHRKAVLEKNQPANSRKPQPRVHCSLTITSYVLLFSSSDVLRPRSLSSFRKLHRFSPERLPEPYGSDEQLAANPFEADTCSLPPTKPITVMVPPCSTTCSDLLPFRSSHLDDVGYPVRRHSLHRLHSECC